MRFPPPSFAYLRATARLVVVDMKANCTVYDTLSHCRENGERKRENEHSSFLRQVEFDAGWSSMPSTHLDAASQAVTLRFEHLFRQALPCHAAIDL